MKATSVATPAIDSCISCITAGSRTSFMTGKRTLKELQDPLVFRVLCCLVLTIGVLVHGCQFCALHCVCSHMHALRGRSTQDISNAQKEGYRCWCTVHQLVLSHLKHCCLVMIISNYVSDCKHRLKADPQLNRPCVVFTFLAARHCVVRLKLSNSRHLADIAPWTVVKQRHMLLSAGLGYTLCCPCPYHASCTFTDFDVRPHALQCIVLWLQVDIHLSSCSVTRLLLSPLLFAVLHQ